MLYILSSWFNRFLEHFYLAKHSVWWLMPVISATQEADGEGLLGVWDQSRPHSEFQAILSCRGRSYLKNKNPKVLFLLKQLPTTRPHPYPLAALNSPVNFSPLKWCWPWAVKPSLCEGMSLVLSLELCEGRGVLSKAFLHLMRWCGSSLSICLYDGVHISIYTCWTVPAAVGWSLLDHCGWFFWFVVGFYWFIVLAFYWEFLHHLCS